MTLTASITLLSAIFLIAVNVFLYFCLKSTGASTRSLVLLVLTANAFAFSSYRFGAIAGIFLSAIFGLCISYLITVMRDNGTL